LVSLGFTWFHLVSLGFTWFHLVSLGSLWFHLVTVLHFTVSLIIGTSVQPSPTVRVESTGDGHRCVVGGAIRRQCGFQGTGGVCQVVGVRPIVLPLGGGDGGGPGGGGPRAIPMRTPSVVGCDGEPSLGRGVRGGEAVFDGVAPVGGGTGAKGGR